MNALGTIDPEYQFGSQNASGNGRTLRVSTSQGLDAIKLTDLDIDGLAVILSGDADDVVNTIRTRAHDRINVRTGTGNDQVTVESTATPTMNLNLEDGSDTFTQVTGGALPALRRLDGGAGPDTAVLNGGPVGVIVNVETIVP